MKGEMNKNEKRLNSKPFLRVDSHAAMYEFPSSHKQPERGKKKKSLKVLWKEMPSLFTACLLVDFIILTFIWRSQAPKQEMKRWLTLPTAKSDGWKAFNIPNGSHHFVKEDGETGRLKDRLRPQESERLCKFWPVLHLKTLMGYGFFNLNKKQKRACTSKDYFSSDSFFGDKHVVGQGCLMV